MSYEEYEIVSGLETHIEMSTNTKIFCDCTTAFGGQPNTHCCPICIGLPGTLPKINKQAIKYAIMAGLATNCTIRQVSKMDRKNYCYPDLPKAYQISQFDKPLCEHGYVTLDSGKKIGITRIHIEEDAGKLVHERGNTYIDYNRGGVPLIEIVSEPDIRTPEEAREYAEKLQLIMKYIGISDCKMQEGSMRCDVNISVRKKGQTEFGTRAELKNINSFNYIIKAMEYEFERQVELVQNGERVVQETRRYDEKTGATQSMRDKEDAHDYRYFRDPDLVTISTTAQEIEDIKNALPELPDVKLKRYIEQYALPAADAVLLVRYRKIAEYFEVAAQGIANKKHVCNFIISKIFSTLETEADKDEANIPIPPEYLRELVSLLEDGKIKMTVAKATLDTMLNERKRATDILSKEDLAGMDESELKSICQRVVEQSPGVVADYLGGKEKAIQSLIGLVMRETRGKADAAVTIGILKELIEK